jgi:hypothetical protein
MIVNSLVFHSLRECSLVDTNRLNEYSHGKTILIYDAKGNLVDRKFEQVLLYTNRDVLEKKTIEKSIKYEMFVPREEQFLNEMNKIDEIKKTDEMEKINESIKGGENVTKKQKLEKSKRKK